MKIDVHAHIVPEPYFDFAALEGKPNHYAFRIEHSGATPWSMAPQLSAGFEWEMMYNIERRLRDMDAQGIDMHVLSTTPHLFFYNTPATVAESVTMCRMVNDRIAGVVAQHPDRFVAIADVPLPDGEAAAAELERCVREGLPLAGAWQVLYRAVVVTLDAAEADARADAVIVHHLAAK